MQFLHGIGEIFRKICCPVAADTITDRADVGAVTARLGGCFFFSPPCVWELGPPAKNQEILDTFRVLFCLEPPRSELTGSFITE